MRVCNVSSMHEAGDNRIFQRECVALARGGHESILVVTHDREETIHGVRIVPLRRRRGASRRLLSSLEATRRAAAARADVYHFHDPDLLPWMLWLALRGCVVVFDVHENYAVRFHQWRLPRWSRPLVATVWRCGERLLVRRLDGITAVSESIARLYDGAAREQLVIQNVPDLCLFEGVRPRARPPSPPVIITSGQNDPSRNCMQTVEALPLIHARHPDVVVRFVGRYPSGFDEHLRQRARELGVGRAVDIVGWVPVTQSYQMIADATIGCVFYERNVNNMTTIGNRIFEYMACGVPVLAHDFPELRRIVDESGCGLLLDSSDPRAIANAAIALLDDRETAVAMGLRGRQAVLERHNFSKELQRLEGFFQRLLVQRRGHV